MKKILVTGGDGLVGNSLKKFSNNNFIFINRKDCDLKDDIKLKKIFEEYRPNYVIHTAAKVGGIGLNIKYPAEQFYENILINTNVIHNSYLYGVKKLIAFSSVCAFPKNSDFLFEDNMHNGEPSNDHRSYAYSKRMVDIQIESYNKQYGLNYCSIIPGNIFGENDNFNLEKGHVIPSLIHKCYLSKINNNKFNVWGDGSPLREFIYSDDLAKVCLKLLDLEKLPQKIIVSGEEFSIKEIADIISNYFDIKNINWEIDKPKGQLRRKSDKKIFNQYFNDFKFSNIKESIEKTCKWFEYNYPNIRQ